MRLTERKTCYPQCDKQGNLTKVDYIEIKSKKLAREKLCKLEDIEEALGIDLITLIKAGQQRYIFVKNAFGKINSREIYDIDIYTKIIVYYLEYQPERQFMHQHLNMYGKTWALTEGELV